MVTSNIADSIGGAGQQIVSPLDSTDKSPYLDPQTEHSVARVFQAQANATFPEHVYTNKIKASQINISKKYSKCSVVIQDSDLTQIADYEGQYGIGLNSNIDGYDYMLVLSEDSKANIETSGIYLADKIVLFSGYNRGTYAADLDDLYLTCKYTGIEEMLNEIKIDGILEVDHSHMSTELLSGEITPQQTKYYNNKAIFNENGEKDLFDGYVEADFVHEDLDLQVVAKGRDIVSVFDKTGLQTTHHWNCLDIILYLIGIYHDKCFDIRVKLEQQYRMEYATRFVRFDIGSILRSDLDDMIPIDFNLTGMGLLDAIYKIADESRKYSISKRYESDGVALVGLRANGKAQRQSDNSGDIPLKLQIGEYQAAAVRLDGVESANINMNRENKSVGRVVVRSGHLWINTISTTWGSNVQDPIDSNSKTSKNLAAYSNFSGHLSLMCSDYTESKTGVPAQTYHIITSFMLDKYLGADIGMTLSDFNETLDYEIFETEKIASIKSSLFLPYGNSGSRLLEDMQVYTAYMKQNTSESKWSPVLEDGSDRFHFIQPIAGGQDDRFKIAIKHRSKGFGSFIVYSNADKNDNGLSEHKFKEYIDNSEVPAANKYSKNRGVDTNEIPLYIRCSIKTDYRLKGIAEIAGYDSYKHRTIYVDDNEVNFAIQYKDKTYDGNGGWVNLADGFIDGVGTAEKTALAGLQSKAEAVLFKYTNTANSGTTTLNGCQSAFKPGDMIDEFQGTGRGFDFEAIINKVSLDLIERKTIINYGVNFG